MITHQEQLSCNRLHDLCSFEFQQMESVAATPEPAGQATDPARGLKFHTHHDGSEPGQRADEVLKRGREPHSKSNEWPGTGVIHDVDLRSCLESWPYDPACNVRIGCGADGRQILLVRQPMGLQQFEMDGRPDGSRHHGEETVLQFQHARLDAARRTQPALPFELSAGECAELFHEACALNHRLIVLFHVKDWIRVKRDAAQILRLVELVGQYARRVEDRLLLEPWRPHISRIDFVATAMAQLDQGGSRNARQPAWDTFGFPETLGEDVPGVQTPACALTDDFRGMISRSPAFHPNDESTFMRQDDFWAIRYQGQSVFLKSNKGLECLAWLLRSPGREYHVSQLVACHFGDKTSCPCPAAIPNGQRHGGGKQPVVTNLDDGIAVLDFQAKAECKRRLDDLRVQEDEAERFNDPDRAAKARAEIDAIAKYLATATGLGGRDRKTSSEAERARCAITKRIKQAIQKIAGASPVLGHHLTARIKTGYFCSYNPHPDRPVAWKF